MVYVKAYDVNGNGIQIIGNIHALSLELRPGSALAAFCPPDEKIVDGEKRRTSYRGDTFDWRSGVCSSSNACARTNQHVFAPVHVYKYIVCGSLCVEV